MYRSLLEAVLRLEGQGVEGGGAGEGRVAQAGGHGGEWQGLLGEHWGQVGVDGGPHGERALGRALGWRRGDVGGGGRHDHGGVG